jgi:RNA polymerase sigma-70 factor (ECF subfamily)
VQEQRKFGTFEQVVLPHLDAAYNLARWLTRREHDAEDVVQEAYLRAFNAFEQFHGGDARCWLLTIVRNACYTWLTRNRERAPATSFDEALHDVATCEFDPQAILQQHADRDTLRRAIDELPVEFREVLILRELEELSYQQIASVADLPVGTVMSRLARARQRLGQALGARTPKEARNELP